MREAEREYKELEEQFLEQLGEDGSISITLDKQNRMREVCRILGAHEVYLMKYRFMVEANLTVARGEQSIAGVRSTYEQLEHAIVQTVPFPDAASEDERLGLLASGVSLGASGRIGEHLARRWISRLQSQSEKSAELEPQDNATQDTQAQALSWVSNYMLHRPNLRGWAKTS